MIERVLELTAIGVLTLATLVLGIGTFVGALWGAIAMFRRRRRERKLMRAARALASVFAAMLKPPDVSWFSIVTENKGLNSDERNHAPPD